MLAYFIQLRRGVCFSSGGGGDGVFAMGMSGEEGGRAEPAGSEGWEKHWMAFKASYITASAGR